MVNHKTKLRKVVIIGTGLVGTSYAYALLNQGVVNELVLIDINKDRADGEVRDLNHGMAFGNPMSIKTGDYEECHNADLVVITAGIPQKPGETRLDLVSKNAKVFEGIIRKIMDVDFQGIFLVASNPVDILTHLTREISGLPKERVIGSGTILDTARFRYLLGEHFRIDTRNIHGYIIGEHGDSELPVWSHVQIGGIPLSQYAGIDDFYKHKDMQQIFENVRDAAYHIIERKGATYYGIGLGLVRLTKAILNNENAILTISAHLDGQYGLHDVYIGVPALLNENGVREVLELDLTEMELSQLHKSAAILQEMIDTGMKAIKN
ncbi:L-lactate dehydrogenase [Gracilibacillus boraciitolerans JCM 21714]|uniref:L-lactate dehydrogenase n=1 Tax=Gracilibacillus boraciitolerans JCM 21714 TaxID=1298598 RepID=W4VJ37_9BACI|nr:L-lactate dehydrogenase [Gracilibacillus boraciitolerans]GAE92779.1 L-lactate dehydrogenase [Gracilibacillus boraciitolerans JCM 21714]